MKAVNIILLPKKSLTFKQRGGFVSQDDGGGQVWSLRPGNLAFNDSAQKSYELTKKQFNLTLFSIYLIMWQLFAAWSQLVQHIMSKWIKSSRQFCLDNQQF